MKKNILFAVLYISLFVYSYFLVSALTQINTILSLITSIAVFSSVFLLVKNQKLLVLGASLLLLLAFYSTQMAIRDSVREKLCFKFDVSYPGTTDYDTCVSSLKLSDYINQAP